MEEFAVCPACEAAHIDRGEKDRSTAEDQAKLRVVRLRRHDVS